MMEWQQIETAPKDGTRVYVAHELDRQSMSKSKYFGLNTGSYEDGVWQPSAFFMCSDGMLRRNPTHWMPLPEPTSK